MTSRKKGKVVSDFVTVSMKVQVKHQFSVTKEGGGQLLGKIVLCLLWILPNGHDIKNDITYG